MKNFLMMMMLFLFVAPVRAQIKTNSASQEVRGADVPKVELVRMGGLANRFATQRVAHVTVRHETPCGVQKTFSRTMVVAEGVEIGLIVIYTVMGTEITTPAQLAEALAALAALERFQKTGQLPELLAGREKN